MLLFTSETVACVALSIADTPPHSPCALQPVLTQCLVKIERRRYQGQVAKGLRRVAQLLTRARNFFREDMQVIPKAQHILEDRHSLQQILFIVRASLRTLVKAIESQ